MVDYVFVLFFCSVQVVEAHTCNRSGVLGLPCVKNVGVSDLVCVKIPLF